MQLPPRGHTADLSEEPVAPSQLLLGSIFDVREALLHDQWQANEHFDIVLDQRVGGNSKSLIDQRFPKEALIYSEMQLSLFYKSMIYLPSFDEISNKSALP
jgi:hypothetical protein